MANTTSSSYSFDQDFSIDEIIADAYERLGLVGTAGHQIKTARRSLNILFQEWGNRGIHFWEVGNTNVNLVQGSQPILTLQLKDLVFILSIEMLQMCLEVVNHHKLQQFQQQMFMVFQIS